MKRKTRLFLTLAVPAQSGELLLAITSDSHPFGKLFLDRRVRRLLVVNSGVDGTTLHVTELRVINVSTVVKLVSVLDDQEEEY